MELNSLCVGCLNEKGGANICPVCRWVEGTVPESPVQLPPRTILFNKYMLGRTLGHGGFGITYLAWDIALQRKVAIKEFFPHNIVSRSTGQAQVSLYSDKNGPDYEYGLKKFLDEGVALAKFHDHPGIIMVLDSFQANGTGYIVMEYVDGITFKEYLSRAGNRISYEQALSILIPVMDSLREIHKSGLLHRDISPDNIYITHKGQVKLLDFGAARYELGEHSKSLSVILKDGFSPEEQYRSRGKQGAWTDIYSLGATFYRAVTGLVPMQALDRMENDELRPPSAIGIQVPPEAEIQLMKALAVKASERPQTVKELQDVLMAHAGIVPVGYQQPGSQAGAWQPNGKAQQPHSGTRSPEEIKPKSRLPWIIASIVFFLLSGVLIFMWQDAQDSTNSYRYQYHYERNLRHDLDKKVSDLNRQNQNLKKTLEEEKKKRLNAENKSRVLLTTPLSPVVMSNIRVRNQDYSGNVIDDFGTNFVSSKIKYMAVHATLHNKYPKLRQVSGYLVINYINPNGTIIKLKNTKGNYTLSKYITLSNSTNVTYSIGNRKGGTYKAGWNYIRFYWKDKKIGEAKFYVF